MTWGTRRPREEEEVGVWEARAMAYGPMDMHAVGKRRGLAFLFLGGSVLSSQHRSLISVRRLRSCPGPPARPPDRSDSIALLATLRRSHLRSSLYTFGGAAPRSAEQSEATAADSELSVAVCWSSCWQSKARRGASSQQCGSEMESRLFVWMPICSVTRNDRRVSESGNVGGRRGVMIRPVFGHCAALRPRAARDGARRIYAVRNARAVR
ncbi:hypothetical protein MPTK1_1g22280 [Marchantia polymorpha subsp. ruderalis]|uniref:Uncharacterized protein n=2 Tax=Marchantia polymorpha TaxID=3197 RepID=A0AAF6AT27_MARPO|nr:hypothetical protein MARPO_0001s0566 [Marchantia polymorpha]BBM99597.1 hypothetical protein Mp_1g22280 [Marchantia polymorpha subsp. ruderalis]|eukprot:PTQ50685.1 hypothetical protein MARPO_0001s0566 [Marchantia polymorpha]